MKNIIKTTTIIVAICFANISFSQNTTNTFKFEKCNENCIQQLNLEFELSDIYNVKVIGTTGKLITTLAYQKQFNEGDSRTFELNTKRWKAGVYKLLIQSNQGYRKAKTIRITEARN